MTKGKRTEIANPSNVVLEYGEKWLETPPPELFKFLNLEGRSPYQNMAWPLPTLVEGEWVPGEWVEVTGPLQTCRHGLHFTDVKNAPQWMSQRLFSVEIDGGVVQSQNKYVAFRARLTREWPDWHAAAYGQRGVYTIAPWSSVKPILRALLRRSNLEELVPFTRTAESWKKKVAAVSHAHEVAKAELSVQRAKAHLDYVKGGYKNFKQTPRAPKLAKWVNSLGGAASCDYNRLAGLEALPKATSDLYSYTWNRGNRAKELYERDNPPEQKEFELPDGFVVRSLFS